MCMCVYVCVCVALSLQGWYAHCQSGVDFGWDSINNTGWKVLLNLSFGNTYTYILYAFLPSVLSISQLASAKWKCLALSWQNDSHHRETIFHSKFGSFVRSISDGRCFFLKRNVSFQKVWIGKKKKKKIYQENINPSHVTFPWFFEKWNLDK